MRSGWGVFTHYLPLNRDAPVTDAAAWNAIVDSFNATHLAEQLADVGACYYFITIGQVCRRLHRTLRVDPQPRTPHSRTAVCIGRLPSVALNLLTPLATPAAGLWVLPRAKQGLRRLRR